MAVARFNADGSRDTGFGTAGLTTESLPDHPATGRVIGSSYANRASSRATQVYVAGVASWTSVSAENNVNFAVARLNADGTPDTTYAAIGGSAVITGEPTSPTDWGCSQTASWWRPATLITARASEWRDSGERYARHRRSELPELRARRFWGRAVRSRPTRAAERCPGRGARGQQRHRGGSGARCTRRWEVAKIEMLHVTPQGTIIAGQLRRDLTRP
jgi:hypothetical protein